MSRLAAKNGKMMYPPREGCMSPIREFIDAVGAVAKRADEPAVKEQVVKQLFGAYVAKARTLYPDQGDMANRVRRSIGDLCDEIGRELARPPPDDVAELLDYAYDLCLDFGRPLV
jgi:hypothetical protein